MILAYDFPLLGFFWTFLWLYVILAWLALVFHVIIDVFFNDTLGGLGKAGWLLVVLMFPLVGVIAYTVRHGGGMADKYGGGVTDRRTARSLARDRTIVRATGARAVR